MMDTISVIVGFLAVLSTLLAILSLYLGVTSARQLKRTGKLIGSISGLVSSAQELGVTMVYKSRNEALEKYWSNHMKDEKTEVIVMGTSLRGLLTGSPDIMTIISSEPKKFKFLLVHPEVAEQIDREERIQTVRVDVLNTLHNLMKWGVPEGNIQLLKRTPRNFVIMTSTRVLINPTVYETDAFRYFSVECERKNEGDVYHQYRKYHFEVAWSDEDFAVPFKRDELDVWYQAVARVG